MDGAILVEISMLSISLGNALLDGRCFSEMKDRWGTKYRLLTSYICRIRIVPLFLNSISPDLQIPSCFPSHWLMFVIKLQFFRMQLQETEDWQSAIIIEESYNTKNASYCWLVDIIYVSIFVSTLVLEVLKISSLRNNIKRKKRRSDVPGVYFFQQD